MLGTNFCNGKMFFLIDECDLKLRFIVIFEGDVFGEDFIPKFRFLNLEQFWVKIVNL